MQNIHASLNDSNIKITVSDKIHYSFQGKEYRTVNMGEHLSMTLNDLQQKILFDELDRHLHIRTRNNLENYISSLEEQLDNTKIT